jgi:hypothetical protein
MAARKEPELTRVVLECQDWHDGNCVFLSDAARKAFVEAYWAAGERPELLSDPNRTDEVKNALRETHEAMRKAGPIILQEVGLPSLGDRESESAIKEKGA